MSPSVAPGVAQPSSDQPQSEVVPSKKPPTSTSPKTTAQNVQQKRRSGKPIINWFQRKLAGTVRAKRVDTAGQAVDGKGRSSSVTTRPSTRVVSSPLPSPVPNTGRQQGRLDTLRRKTISLNGDNDARDASILSDDDERSMDDSVTRDSMWSPNSALEADEDASLRPLPPSSPPSPSPSRSSSSYLSDPRTFKSIAASTKPTTLLSIDLNGNGMAHIAQAPITPISQTTRFHSHARTSSTSTTPNPLGSGASITFSAFPPSPQSSSRPDSLREAGSSTGPSNNGIVQAPLHTTHHPRNNPRPSSPPLDNASVLTLASSAYAIPGLRVGSVTPAWGSAPPSAVGGGDSVSQFGGTYEDVESTSQLALGDDERLDDRDANASLRALRPRSTRRGSWESEASRWSARIQVGTGTPSVARDRSLWTTNSIRTGALSADNADASEKSEDADDATGDVSTTGEVMESVTESFVPLESQDVDAKHTALSDVNPESIEKAADFETGPSSQKTDAHPEFSSNTDDSTVERHLPTDTITQSPASNDSEKTEKSKMAKNEVDEPVEKQGVETRRKEFSIPDEPSVRSGEVEKTSSQA